MKHTKITTHLALAAALTLVVAACGPAHQPPQALTGSYEFVGPVFDVEATPDGGLLVTRGTTVHRIGSGGVEQVVEVPTVEGSPVNGLATIDQDSFYATSGGLDLAVGAGLWRVDGDVAMLVADIEAFAHAHHPDAREGPQWKDPQCELDQGFSPGPQSNPYHLTTVGAGQTLVADAAGNTLLAAGVDGTVDWVAVFTPPLDEDGDWRVLAVQEDETVCYVEPVPAAVAVGPDGASYVGELTGLPGTPGWSRVWRIDAGARNVVCPSDACREVVSGLTSVIDVLFGPDGALFVVELDENGWLAPILGDGAGGTVKRCDVATGACTVVERSTLPIAAITLDARGQLWVVENESLTGPGVATVRRVEAP